MRRRQLLGAIGGGAVLLGGGYLGVELFAPETATEVDEDRTGTDDGGSTAPETPGANAAGGGASDTGGSENGAGDGGNGAGDSREESGGVETLKRGEFTGKDGHECSGTVELARDEEGLFLQFRDYRQTQGPDVFCYLTPAEDPDTSEEVAAGRKIRIDGGADGGEITKTGTFPQDLPGDTDVEGTSGVAIWCENFAVPFGAATLRAV